MRQTLKWRGLRQRSNLDSSKVPRHHQHPHALGGEHKDEDYISESPTELAALFRNDQEAVRVMSPLRGQSSSHNQIGLLWGVSNGCHRPEQNTSQFLGLKVKSLNISTGGGWGALPFTSDRCVAWPYLRMRPTKTDTQFQVPTRKMTPYLREKRSHHTKLH